ncbi:hypothetical protein AVDCRST_MAG94-6936 [uncultured Leptolyngbya sp.]|uniref:Uncharacterized protein n=1 Tax=uncultured Leptolyngbya sp. TaxID=332963 RepID=A0A6J4PRF4_9CYAN|nr:hypothetical protein AVDCRST_MAG94-6936 [uncultured Leptolyngbya sp.]
MMFLWILLWALATPDQVGMAAMPRLAASLFILGAFHHKVAPKASYLYALKQIKSSCAVSATQCFAYAEPNDQMASREVNL